MRLAIFFQIIEFVAALKWLIFKGRRVSLVSKTVIVSQVKMMKEHLDFCVLEIDLKKFTFTTVEATTEVLLIKQKKGASYNFLSHDLTCCGLYFAVSHPNPYTVKMNLSRCRLILITLKQN